MADIVDKDAWSWRKFFGGFFNGKNYAKSIVLMFCSGIILVICFSTYTVIKQKFTKKEPTQTVGTNNGTITTENTDKQGNTWSLFNLINWR